MSEMTVPSELIMTKMLLHSAQEQAQIFEACYEAEKRAHAATREDLHAAQDLLGIQQERMEWLLGGEWPGKHS
jgi:hypothetical protein